MDTLEKIDMLLQDGSSKKKNKKIPTAGNKNPKFGPDAGKNKYKMDEIHGRGMAQLLKVKDADKARKVLKKKGVKFSEIKDGFHVGDDDFDTAEEALLRANILRF